MARDGGASKFATGWKVTKDRPEVRDVDAQNEKDSDQSCEGDDNTDRTRTRVNSPSTIDRCAAVTQQVPQGDGQVSGICGH